MTAAIYGFIGVLLGSATTVVVTVYQERWASAREREARQHQREQDRKDQRDSFQRQSLLALQDAVADLIKALFNEQDRQLKQMKETKEWPARNWETPTADGWVDAEFGLQIACARVFDQELRDLALHIRSLGMQSIWAHDLDKAKDINGPLEQENERFHLLMANALSKLY